ncbi:PREDICTED: transcription factor E2F7 [Condylura cristata]|uniref:transcription factor E2F7 n=1 Tax=Condylura cristata TaxID=143302 RepID=UPI00033463CF|nr:PREDICTED: transcription factor E2F7 [Condylura cristata]
MEVNCLTLKDLINPRQPRIDCAVEDGDNAQKENIFVDRSRMTPKTPIKNEPIDLSKQKIFTPERNPITPVKLVDRQQVEPWTPTANLKMLISAASPDIRDREKKKELFRPIENKDDAFTDTLQLDVGDSAVDEFEKQRPSRKQKSLGLLCQKFLARYPSYPLSTEKTTISLDEVAVSLGVERRRIYDIVNVLESLHLVSRVAKNQYGWHGRHSLPQTLRNLQRLGEEQKYEEQMAHLQQKELDLMDYKFEERKKDGYLESQDQQLLEFSEPDYPSSSANSRKDKSLRIMSQKFVMLFLVSKTKIVTLDVAAKILIEESQDTPDQSKFKTKVRRLYDIANVLTSLALIKKVHVTEERGRKPAFKWIGPVDFSSSDEELVDVSAPVLPERKRETYGQGQVCGKQKLARHGSFNTAQSSERIQRKVNSEPNSPYKEQGSGGYSLEIGSLAAVYRQKIEHSSQEKPFASEKMMPPSSSPDPAAPFPVLPIDSDYRANPLANQVFSVAQTDLQAFSTHGGLNGQVGSLLASAASDVESLRPALLAGQPLVYVPSTSLFMLYGNLQEGPTPRSGAGSERDSQGSEVLTAAESSSSPSVQKRLGEERKSQEEEEPATKRQSRDYEDGPLSLVMPKKPSDSTDIASAEILGSRGSTPQEDIHMNGHLSAAKEFLGTATMNGFVSSEWGNPSRNTEIEKPSKESESAKEPSLLQYLYVQPPAGLNGFNVLLSGSQPTHAVGPSSGQLPSLGVPCMIVPSPTVGPFPVLYSPTVPGPVASAPGSLPSAGPVNFGLPGLTSTAHLLISPAAMVNPKSSTLTSADPQLQGQCALNLSPVIARSHHIIQPESPIFGAHPTSVVKLPQSPAPVTPKSVRRSHRETFFKTPGSLGDPVLRRRERNQSRNTSSAQRRLEIPSSNGTD